MVPRAEACAKDADPEGCVNKLKDEMLELQKVVEGVQPQVDACEKGDKTYCEKYGSCRGE